MRFSCNIIFRLVGRIPATIKFLALLPIGLGNFKFHFKNKQYLFYLLVLAVGSHHMFEHNVAHFGGKKSQDYSD